MQRTGKDKMRLTLFGMRNCCPHCPQFLSPKRVKRIALERLASVSRVAYFGEFSPSIANAIEDGHRQTSGICTPFLEYLH
jgi:hypothetical protein